MTSDFERQLSNYADVIVKVGLNIQPGQRLWIGTPHFERETAFEAAPLVREVARKAYDAGAKLVEVLWGDPELYRIRIEHAPPDSLDEYPTWQTDSRLAHLKRGDAALAIYAPAPGFWDDLDQDAATRIRRAGADHNREAYKITGSGLGNYCVISAPTARWAAKLFPDLPVEEQQPKLWETLFKMCRADREDPIAAWGEHLKQLTAVKDYLNGKRYTTLKLNAPGTDLTVGLPDGHYWNSAGKTSDTGIYYVSNVPTEEAFTLPHREKVDGVVTATKPLNIGGNLVEDFTLTFEKGQVVNSTVGKGADALRNLLENYAGAKRLGEIALTPHSSPISQSGLLFYNTLYDENASSHVALGNAYPTSLEGGKQMDDEQFTAAGGNRAEAHVDFMIGSGEMDVDGVCADGSIEAIMRRGEWAFDV